MSTSGDSWDIYNIAYGIDGPVALFEATGKTQYLDQALVYVQNIISKAVVSSSLPGSTYKDSYLSWGAYTHPTVTDGNEYPLFESYGWRYVTEMLRAIRQNPTVYANSTYRAKYDSILAFTKQNIFNKWFARGANSHIYRSRTHMASHWGLISLNLWMLTDDATEKAKYKTIVDNINLHLPNYASSLRQQMVASPLSPGGYFWSDVWGSTAAPGQDVSHGNAVITYVIAARTAGIEWTAADMDAFSNILLNVVWKPNGSGGYTYPYYLDGSGTGNGWFSDGFIKLGRYNVQVQKRVEAHTVGRGIQLYGHGALNAKILNGQ